MKLGNLEFKGHFPKILRSSVISHSASKPEFGCERENKKHRGGENKDQINLSGRIQGTVKDLK